MKFNRPTIAVAFDNPVDHQLIAEYLSGMDYEVVTISGEHIPKADLFLLDVPSARRFGRVVMERKRTGEVLLPAMVALGRRDPADPWLAAGYDDILRMPLSRAELRASIGILLRLRQQTLELKKKGEEKYQAIFEATGTATLLVDEDTTILMANQECLRLTGYSAKELMGTPWTRYVAPESLEQMLKYHKLRRKDPGKAPKQYEAKLVNKKGQVRHTVLTVEMMPGTKQSVVSMVDITPQKKAEEEASRTAQEWQATFDASNDVIWILDREQRVLRSNKVAEKYFKRPCGEIVGRHCWEIAHNTKEPIPECPLIRAQQNLKRGTMDLQLGERWFQVTVDPIPDKQGHYNGSVHIIRNITERKEMENALRESEERFRIALKNSPIVVFNQDRELRYTWIYNPHPGFDPQAVLGKIDAELLPADDAARLTEIKRRILKTGVPAREEVRTTIDGQAFFYDLTVEPLRDANGNIIGVTCASIEITERKRMEEKLRQSEANLRAYLEGAPDAVYINDLEGVFLYGNKAAENLTGYKREELIGKNFLDLSLLQEKDLERARELLAQNALGKPTGPDEFELVRKDGSLVWVEINTTLIRQGQEPVVIGFVRDITERKRMELIQTAQYNIARAMIAETDLASLFETIRKELSTFLDTRNFVMALYDEKSGMLHTPFARDEKDSIPPSWPAKTSLTGQVIKKKKPLLLHRKDIEILAQKGKIEIMGTIPEVWLGIPLFSEDKIVGALVLQNYQDRNAYDKRAVEVLEVVAHGLRSFISLKRVQAVRERLSAAIEQAAETVLITDTQGNIEYVNPAFERITGYSQSEVLEKNPRILKSGQHDAQFYRELWETISSGKTWRGKFINRRKDGSLYTEEASISPVFDADGNIVHYVAVNRDVTREEELEQQLLQAQKMEAIGRLAGGVAHDFNNMLSIILGYSELMLFQINREDPLWEILQQIINAGQRAAALTRQLLAFSRKQTLQPEVLDLNNLIRNLEKMLRRLIGEDIDLKLHLSDDISPVMADPGQIEQVVMNLAVNARDAMPGGGKLTIETANVELDEEYALIHTGVKPGKYTLIALSDTGYGMDKETVSKIFEPFFTTKEKGKGTGLGLSTVYGIVKQSGGNIWVYSEPGKGTTFKIYLPQVKAEPKEKKKVEDTAAAALTGGGHILLVEDEKAVRNLCEAMLLHSGYKVTVAANGGEALLLLEEKGLKPDLVLTDVVMPHMSGKELVQRLRKKCPDLKVLYMSGYTDDAIVHHGVLAPNTPFIKKPFNIRDLVKKVQQVLKGRES